MGMGTRQTWKWKGMGIDSKIHSQSSLQGGPKMALIEQIAAPVTS